MSDDIVPIKMSAIFSQEGDDSSETPDVEQELEIETHDNGAGPFYTISTKRWAFENAEELTDMLNYFITRAKGVDISGKKEPE